MMFEVWYPLKAPHSTIERQREMKSETAKLSTKLAIVQAALKGTPAKSYLGISSLSTDGSQETKSWGPAMRI
jgi:hypothetical protein